MRNSRLRRIDVQTKSPGRNERPGLTHLRCFHTEGPTSVTGRHTFRNRPPVIFLHHGPAAGIVTRTMSTEDLHDSRGVYIEYPVYVLADDADEVAAVGSGADKWLPLFSDLDNAERYIEDRPLADHSPFELPTREHLRAVLDSAAGAGVKSVALDPDGSGRRKAAVFPVDHFLSCLREST